MGNVGFWFCVDNEPDSRKIRAWEDLLRSPTSRSPYFLHIRERVAKTPNGVGHLRPTFPFYSHIRHFECAVTTDRAVLLETYSAVEPLNH